MSKKFLTTTIAVAMTVGVLLSNGSLALAADNVQDLQKRIQTLETENKMLKEKLKQSGSAAKVTVLENNGAPKEIAGCFGESQIRGLAKLGVFNLDPKTFGPQDHMTRGEYAVWLVKANNLINKPHPDANYAIRLAEPGSKSTFSDVKSNSPYFRAVQGLANAGYSVGYEDGTFKPDKALTREELIQLKALVDWAGTPYRNDRPESILANSNYIKFQDRNEIDHRYLNAFMGDTLYGTAKNIERAFGSVRLVRPKELVTKAEAAVTLWQFGGHNNSERWEANADKLVKK